MRTEMAAIDPALTFEERRRERYMRRSVRAAKEEAAECMTFLAAFLGILAMGAGACRLAAMVLLAMA